MNNKNESSAGHAARRSRLVVRGIIAFFFILLMANLGAIIDAILHPEIEYFDSEHIIVGLSSAFVVGIMMAIIIIYIERMEKAFQDNKQVEEALRESEQKYRGIFDESIAVIYVFDNQKNFVDANQSGLGLLGYSRDELLRMSIPDVDADPVVVIPAHEELLTGGRLVNYEHCLRRKDGTVITVLNNSKPIKDVHGNVVGMLSTLLDITERKRAEQALQESEARFRAVVQTANDAIITMDTHGVIVDWNAAAESIFGYSANEALGIPVSRIVPEQFYVLHRRGIERVSASDERLIVGKMVEVAGQAKDGREFPIEMSLAEWETQEGAFFTAIIRDVAERKQRENELQAIVTLSAALRIAPTRAEMLPIIIEQIGTLLNSDAATVEIIDPQTGDVATEVANGVWANLAGLRQAKGTGINAIISRTLEAYITHDLVNDPNMFYHEWARAGIRGSAGVPLIAQEKLIGFIWVGRKTDITELEVRSLVAVADIAANAIYRATLHEQTQKDAANLALAYDTTLEGWARALELRDHETEGHTRRVVQMTLDLACAVGIRECEFENIRRGALLHDIGKMGIPDSILLKPGALDEREWKIMRQHSEYAYKLLEPIEYLHPVLDIPHYHHERWDGTGYPRGLKGEEIPLSARIFAIVDVWDALQSDRPYRAAWSKKKALTYIAAQSEKHFDPIIVDAFLKIV